MRPHPRHRGDCADFFATAQQPARIALDAPVSSISEHAAALAGRTWNDQLTYVIDLCLGDHPPDFNDERSTEDWRTLMSPWNKWITGHSVKVRRPIAHNAP
jgi:hypothetical protein